ASASTLTGLISAINSTTTASGSGYAVDDLITLTGGSGDAVAKVLTVSSGGVQESFNITVNGTSSSGSIASIYLLGYTGYSLTIGSGSSAVNTANAIVSKINEGTKHIATNGTGSLPVVTLTSILPGYYASGILCSYSDPTQTMSGSIITLGSGGGVGSVSLLSSGSSGYSVSTGNVTTGGSGSGCTIEITGIEASGGGSIVDVNLLSSGSSGYSVSTGNVTTGGSGSGCTVNITGIEANGGGSATSVSLYYGGQSKYTVGSGNVTTGGSGSGCTVNITEVTPDVGLLGGVVSSISLLSSGSSGYSVSTGNVTTGGSGSGCTVNITGINKNTGGEVNLLELISEGSSGYSVSTGNVTTGGSGSGCTVNITEVKAISGGIVSEVTLLSSGSSGYVVNKRNITTGGSGSGCIIDITGINSIYSGIKGACGAHWVMLSSSSLWDISGNMNNLQKSSSSNNPIFEIGRSSDRLALSMNLVDHGVNSSLIYTGNTTNDIDSYAGLTAEFLINGVDKTFADGTGLIILKRETTSAAGTSLVGDGYLISIDSDEETFSYTAKSGSTTSVASASISTYLLEEPRRYHYFTVTCKNNKAKFFVDGEYISSGSITVNPQNISNSPTELYISNNNSSSYNIAIDEIMISPWASTPDSIKERFIQYAPRYIEPIIIASGSVDNYYQSKVSVFASGSGDFQYYGFALKAIEPRVFRSKDLSYYNLYKLPLEKT
ncbi:MAG: LamG-like jellyroll fold domain-containing protein, partial [Candidatus Pacearchaeota archaeon]